MSKRSLTTDSEDASAWYSKKDFWVSAASMVKSAALKALETGMVLYYCLQDRDTPAWAKSVIVGALGYMIMPLDAIPDVLPMVGYSDDLGVLAAALATVAVYIKDEHRRKAAAALVKIKERMGGGDGMKNE